MKEEMAIQAIQGEEYQHELIEAITVNRAVYVYKVEELIGDLLPELEGFFQYETFSGSGNPEFFVCNKKPTDRELRNALLDIAEINEAIKAAA